MSMFSKQLLSSKFVVVVLAAFLLFLGNLKYGQWKNQQAINKQKQDLTNQINSMSQKNDQLNQSISYLNSSSFKERVAREQLNLKKTGNWFILLRKHQARL